LSSRPPEDYFLEIEAHFAQLRGTPFVVSAKDWALIKSWNDESVPLAIVIEAIDRCFEKREKSGRKGTISSIAYCRHAVKELWAERRDLQVGGEGAVPEADPQSLLEELARTIEETAGRQDAGMALRLSAVAEQVRASSSGKSVPQIEEQLMTIEHDMIESLLGMMPEGERDALREEAEQLLAGYGSLDVEVIRKSRDANLRRLFRKKYALPRLSLFG